jgi:SURF4 family
MDIRRERVWSSHQLRWLDRIFHFTESAYAAPVHMVGSGDRAAVIGRLDTGHRHAYCTILAFVFVLVATALGHRYWEYPAAQQVGQYINFLKNISIMGGALAVVTGGGRFSLDRMLAKQ